ncbi:hypothetical protein GJW-30_1_00014 [Variibacter gotjawalensis]|uniref:Uncharacterized protein n=1 Tax=Variibacter gotjawalensis TaxID=1333996 RepID=A0A0S3PNJ2_9BRAD|nr:hypothetical protein [Variibacter gotjawalensis]RZS49680.1 hypothetical protein EV661_2119 [Variibacter gotjawalensis]BAT57509.1 hypothetical protein GJW-30_1_00014 [Variibacter gotjawalensis]
MYYVAHNGNRLKMVLGTKRKTTHPFSPSNDLAPNTLSNWNNSNGGF